MDEKEARQKLSKALERVIEDDTDLLRYDVNERSITHRLAVYLEEEVGGDWDVDVEYNRVGENEVSKAVSMEHLTSKIPDNVDPEDLDAKTVYPDIIVHNRGDHYDNLLVVEAKKSGRSGEYDREKITAYKKELRYEHGVFVTFTGVRPEEDPGYCWDWHPFEE
ncbi:hypothetical protein C479_13348 [Halovivax asiaticus JCM 14624]|uniref:Type I restriction enzyme R protein N-terminal domain-containing protein n=1 Tax=Halovivax asiaticus JCM 14624 TaxID=1227490 RepID=M0BCX4_9EURY|nr:hypothetical protein [Halovivax asiaticus]ELZ08327.1 hypothetical protein C479_13348 [Halovivax asiaticus JCM 14624]